MSHDEGSFISSYARLNGCEESQARSVFMMLDAIHGHDSDTAQWVQSETAPSLDTNDVEENAAAVSK